MELAGGYPLIPFGSVEGGSGIPRIPNLLDYDAYEGFFKALTSGTGVTDVASLTGGGALRRQSLEATLLAVIQQFTDFRLWNMAEKSNATATVDEWTEETAVGGYPGSSFNSELGAIGEQDATLRRRTLQIKYLMTKRRVSFVKELEGGIASATSVQQTGGALELLTSGEWGLFNGDSSVVPEQFDGLYKIIKTLAPANIVNLKGQPIGNSGEQIVDAAEQVSRFGNFGMVSHGFWSTGVQADLDKGLDPAFRVMMGSPSEVGAFGIMKGAPVIGIKSSFAFEGRLQACFDKLILESQPAAKSATGIFAGALNATIEAAATLGGVAAGDAASEFVAAQAGLYYYAVAPITKDGHGNLTKSAQVTVASGDKVTLTITAGTAHPSGWIVYRSKLNGGNADADFREMTRVADSGAATTVYVDYNTDIPGTSKAYILNMVPGMGALTIRRLLPMMKFPLYPSTTAEILWAQLIFFALRVAKPQQHVILNNVLPRTATWRPFN